MQDGKNPAKIAFIVLAGAHTDEQIRYLSCLEVPEGMTAEVVTIEDAGGDLSGAYRKAQVMSDAKYKVYLAPDAVILFAPFLGQILRIFRTSPDIGILGLRGARQLRTDGIFEHALDICGNVLYRDGQTHSGEPVTGAFLPVSVLGGGVLATQYDVPWPEVPFRDADFLAMAMTLAYRRAGYQAAVPAQGEEWLLRDAPSVPDEAERQAFLDAYSGELYPLVSVVIPTYQRPVYFREALQSVVDQTYRNLDIFVTDNSHNQETKHVYETAFASDPRITYEHHPEYDAKGNWDRALAYDNPAAAYVNWLMDDDLFLPEKIARMMDAFLVYPDITIATSVRKIIDSKGQERTTDAPWAYQLVKETARIDGRKTGRELLLHMKNYLGEPTTALIKKSAMHEGRLGWTGTEGKYLVSDFPTWLCALSKGNCMYFAEPLSAFRMHEGQDQRTFDTPITCMIAWALAMKEAIDRGVFLETLADRRHAILNWLHHAATGLYHFPEEAWDKPIVKDLNKVFRSMAEAMESGGPIQLDIDTGA